MTEATVQMLIKHAEIGVILLAMGYLTMRDKLQTQVMVSALLATLGALGVSVGMAPAVAP